MKKRLKILAIETSCDETAAAVVIDGRVESNIIASQIRLHAKYGGVVPEVAAREHVPVILPVINLALKKAKVSLNQVDAIAVTQGPGLITSLMVGVDTARTLGLALGKPVIPINHLEAHIYANFASLPPPSIPPHKGEGNPNPRIRVPPPRRGRLGGGGQIFPALILIVSGGHTLLVLMRGHGNLKIVGETLDDAAGEAFDKTAKLLGLGYPGGPALSKLAKRGNPNAFDFPRPMINSGDFNFSFSGLKTAVLYKLKELSPITYNLKPNFAASIQQAIVDVLIAKTEQAIKKYQPKTIMLGGGVAANELLRKHYQLLSINYQLNCSIPKLEYCTDNAAMIGLAAYYRVKDQRSQIKNYPFSADPNLMLK